MISYVSNVRTSRSLEANRIAKLMKKLPFGDPFIGRAKRTQLELLEWLLVQPPCFNRAYNQG